MNLVKIVALLILVLSCAKREERKIDSDIHSKAGNNEHFDTVTLSNRIDVSFAYSDSSTSKFGVKFFEHDLPIGQQDILLHEERIYLLDRFHNNIKVLDMKGVILMHTISLSQDQLWLKQMVFFKNNILVISELDSVYVFDSHLLLLERKYLKKGNGRIFFSTNERVVLYYPQTGHEFVEINEFGVIVDTVRGIEHKNDYPSRIKFLENRMIKVENIVFIYPEELVLADRIFDVWDRYIVYYNQDRDSLRLSILEF